jgi:DNA-binding PadR family transcriptional regulator
MNHLIRELWKDNKLLKRLTLLSLSRPPDGVSPYQVSKNVYGDGVAGYSWISKYFKELERDKLVESKKTMGKRGVIYLITTNGEKFLEDKKRELSSL